MRILKARGDIDSALVVAPASVLDQWRSELSRWAPEMSAIIVRGTAEDRHWRWHADRGVMLTGYEVLRSDLSHMDRIRGETGSWDIVVLDEAQRIKNRNRTSEAAKRVLRRRSWALTGTPLENDEADLASILEFVDHDGSEPIKRYHPGVSMALRHRDLQLRRKKDQVLDDLPPKTETILKLPLSADQR